MEVLTREEMIEQLLRMGFKRHKTASPRWRLALHFSSGEKSLFVLVRARGVDVLETPLTPDQMSREDGSLSITMNRQGDRMGEFNYTESRQPIHSFVLELASRFVSSEELSPNHFEKIGMGRKEWAEKYGEKSRSRGSKQESYDADHEHPGIDYITGETLGSFKRP